MPFANHQIRLFHLLVKARESRSTTRLLGAGAHVRWIRKHVPGDLETRVAPYAFITPTAEAGQSWLAVQDCLIAPKTVGYQPEKVPIE